MFEHCKACSHPTPSELHLINIHTNKWSSSHAFDICRFTHQPDSLLWVVGFNAECQLCSMFGTLFVTYPDLFPSAAHSQPPPPHRMFPPAAASLHVNCGIVWERPASQGTARLAFRGRGGISEALRSEKYLVLFILLAFCVVSFHSFPKLFPHFHTDSQRGYSLFLNIRVITCYIKNPKKNYVRWKH